MNNAHNIDTGGDVLLKSVLVGMQDLGATYVKHQNGQLFFDVKRGSQFDQDPEKLQRANTLFKLEYGVTMRIRRFD